MINRGSLPLISIICPVYNASAWLLACIESVLTQDYHRFELLLIDDGSTDGSLKICEDFAARDERIRVFHQENGGASSARNRGLDLMKGDWFCFLDADDEWMEGGLKKLTEGISEDVDWVMAGYETYDEKGSLVYSVAIRTAEILSCEQALMEIYKPRHYHYLGYICSKLFRSSVVRTGGCRFAEDISFGEDRLFSVQFACTSQRPVYYMTQPVYRYRLHPDSAMASLERSFNPRFASDLDATIRIQNIVQSSFPDALKLCRAVDRSVYGSFRKLSDMIRSFGFSDASLVKQLRRKTTVSIGRPTFFALELKRRIRESWKSCCQ